MSKPHGNKGYSIIACVLLTLSIFTVAYAEPSNSSVAPTITPQTVLTTVNDIQANLALIKTAMGHPLIPKTALTVKGAAPREVYFVADALKTKASRLAFEVSGKSLNHDQADLDITNVRPSDVLKLVNRALDNILLVKQTLGITEAPAKIKSADENTTPSDVFNAILQTNHSLSELLSRKFTPSDVFEQITLSINYTDKLLSRFKGAVRIPEQPTFIPNKKPLDVYKRLTRCLNLLREIAKNSSISMLSIQTNFKDAQSVAPSDVYDLAKVNVAELKYFLDLAGIKTNDIQPYYPGFKVPADVYQRAGILLKQLNILQEETAKNPNWIKDNRQS